LYKLNIFYIFKNIIKKIYLITFYICMLTINNIRFLIIFIFIFGFSFYKSFLILFVVYKFTKVTI
jgi:hypothetical protein